MIYDNLSTGDGGRLFFGGADTVALAEKYGTPLYLIDSGRVLDNIRAFRREMTKSFTPASRPAYASKALTFVSLCRLLAAEDVMLDAVSRGEIAVALRAGFNPARIIFHGNAKSEDELVYAVSHAVGLIAVDNLAELETLDCVALDTGRVQDVMLRLTPGVDPHTHDAVNTGRTLSKFGAAIGIGDAEELTAAALGCRGVRLRGFHCHIGSQIFEPEPYLEAARIMLKFMADVREKYGFTAGILDLGGGFPVRYTEDDPPVDIPGTISLIGAEVRRLCGEYSYPVPDVITEPGRSIVADAGITIYNVHSVKKLPGKTFVAVDGGMTDNPRFALYRSRYTVVNADRADAPAELICDVAGRCCE
ncbi:MAG: diaminopimelate decarboxylase, partial [Clostridia bacterium]|nr:diaminopimelate decarboxylase [Clostridia bacterium]